MHVYTSDTHAPALLRIQAEQIVLPAVLCILLVYTAIDLTLGFTQQATCTCASAWASTHITKHEHNTVRLCTKTRISCALQTLDRHQALDQILSGPHSLSLTLLMANSNNGVC